jgi:hypothetical protein
LEQPIYRKKARYETKNFLTDEEKKAIKSFVVFGSTDHIIHSRFRTSEQIYKLIKKSPITLKNTFREEKPFNKEVIAFSLACLLSAGAEGKHILNDLFFKYTKKLLNLYAFVFYARLLKTSKDKIVPFITKYIHNYSLKKFQKEIAMYRYNDYGISFEDLEFKPKTKEEKILFGKILQDRTTYEEPDNVIRINKRDTKIATIIDGDLLYDNEYFAYPFIFAENYNSDNYIVERYNSFYKHTVSLRTMLESEVPLATKERLYTLVYLDVIIKEILTNEVKPKVICVFGAGKEYVFKDRGFTTDIPIIRVYFNEKQKKFDRVMNYNIVGFNKDVTLPTLERIIDKLSV